MLCIEIGVKEEHKAFCFIYLFFVCWFVLAVKGLNYNEFCFQYMRVPIRHTDEGIRLAFGHVASVLRNEDLTYAMDLGVRNITGLAVAAGMDEIEKRSKHVF